MADESTLVRIADLARTLRAACPGDVANLRDAGETLQRCRDEPEHTTARLTANARHAYNAYRANCDQYAGLVCDLLKLVYQQLPAEGRTLRELSRVDEPLDRWDWNAAAGELHGIEVAALAATPTTESPAATKSVKRRRGKANAAMLDMLTRNPECRGWTITQWVKGTRYSRAAICNCRTWKQLKAARDLIAAEHATTKRRRSASRRK